MTCSLGRVTVSSAVVGGAFVLVKCVECFAAKSTSGYSAVTWPKASPTGYLLSTNNLSSDGGDGRRRRKT